MEVENFATKNPPLLRKKYINSRWKQVWRFFPPKNKPIVSLLLCSNNQIMHQKIKSCCMVHVYMFYMWANHPPSKQLKLTPPPPPLLQNSWGALCQEDIVIWVVNKHARKGDILATSFIHYFEYQHSCNIKTTTTFYTKIMLMILLEYCISNSRTQWQKCT